MNEGFKALPEYVQRKIDPEMAEKYMGGGAVLQRPLFRQMGGPAQPMPQDMMPAAPVPTPEEELMQVEGSMEQVGREFVGQMMGNLEAAQDVEGMIDALRGNEAPIEQRYAELAQFVGEADAERTPESVLAMVQPTIMMTEQGAVDSGIGQLMQSLASSDMEDEMGRPTEMGQGVGELMAMGAGNTPPVNFNQGGEVATAAKAYMPQFQELYASVLGDSSEREAELEEQRKLTQAQMLFDIAQTALAAGAPMDRPMSAAERLMTAAQSTQLFPRIGERAAGQLAAKQALDKERRSMDLAALQSAIAAGQSDVSAQQALKKVSASKTGKKPEFKRLVGSDGDILGTFDVNSVDGLRDFNAAIENDPTAIAYNLGTQPKESDFKTIILRAPGKETELGTEYPINTPDQRKIVGELLDKGFTSDDTFFAAAVAEEYAKRAESREEKTQIAAEKRAEIRETNRYIRDRADKIADMDRNVREQIDAEERALGRTLDTEERDILYFEKRLVLQAQMDVAAEERALSRTLDAEERANIEARARLEIKEEMAIRAEARALANRDNIEIREVDGQLMVFDKTKPDEPPQIIFGEASVPDPEYRQFTIQQDGKTISLIEDINSVAGKALIDTVNQQQEKGLGSSMQRISTASVTPKGYLIPKQGVFMSYDGGKTYVDDQGVNQPMPGGAFTVSDTIAYDVAKNERMRASAIAALEELDAQLVEGGDFTKEEKNLVRNAYEAARKGTGFWSKVTAGIDAVVGGITGADVAIETTDARQFVRIVRVLGRSALAVSPKFPVYEMQQFNTIFPNEQTLLANPETEARKLITLKNAITLEKERILEKLASGEPIAASKVSELNQKLFEIERLNDMLGPIETTFSRTSVQDATNSAAQEIFNKALNQGKTRSRSSGRK